MSDWQQEGQGGGAVEESGLTGGEPEEGAPEEGASVEIGTEESGATDGVTEEEDAGGQQAG